MPITKNYLGKENTDYWNKASEARKEVNEWPAWKKSVHTGSELFATDKNKKIRK